MYTINFTSTDVQSINWQLFNSSNVLVTSGNSGTLTTSNFSANFGTLVDGIYTVVIRATNCSSNITDGTKTFIKSSVTTTTTTSTTAIPSSGVTITEPSLVNSQYYYSNGQSPSFYANRANKPVVYLSNTNSDPVPGGTAVSSYITMNSDFTSATDIVYLENSQVKYGINLKRGGQLAYASLAGSNDNLIFNGYDGGFQVQLDTTQILEPANIQGQTSGSPGNNTQYNATMGGDYKNRSQSLIDYKKLNNSTYYVKFRPILYPFNAIVSDVEIEVTYTLIDRALKIDYKYTSFRTDGNYPLNPTAPVGYRGWAIPVCFLVEKLNRYQAYTGNSPAWTNAQVEDGQIPNTTPGQGGGTILERQCKEFWGISYNQSGNIGFGVMNLSEGGTNQEIRWEQREKYSGNPQGGVFGNGGRTVMDMFINVLVPNGGNFTKNITSFVSVGNPSQIRSAFYDRYNASIA
jgi:hypothetical protein